MGANLRFSWERETFDALKVSQRKDDIINKSLKKGIVPIHDQIVKNLKTHVSKIKHKHLKDNIPINEITKDGAKRMITTGFEKSDNSEFFYAKFLEWGTTKQRATPFMQPAYNSKVNKAFEIMQKVVKEELGL